MVMKTEIRSRIISHSVRSGRQHRHTRFVRARVSRVDGGAVCRASRGDLLQIVIPSGPRCEDRIGIDVPVSRETSRDQGVLDLGPIAA